MQDRTVRMPRRTARRGHDQGAYEAWKAAHRPDAARHQARSAALARVAGERDAVEERFRRDWGLDLPESVFTFRAFLLTLGDDEQEAFYDLELSPFGLMDLFDDPTQRTPDGIDVRVHGRYYRDPPEFLTFMHGGSDGLHYGLWYDDGHTCAGVARYYNNDGGGVGLPSGTPLEAVRDTLEWHWRDLDDEDDDTGPPDDDLAERRYRLRLLRETLRTFETDDRAEEGVAYHDARVPTPASPERIVTLDGGGAVVHGTTTLARGPQQDWDNYDFCTALRAQLTGDPAGLAAQVDEARRRLGAGDPAEALVLGRDLHWTSGGDPDRERYAHELLLAAYRALGRPGLAGIAEAHHRHRDLPQVCVLAPQG